MGGRDLKVALVPASARPRVRLVPRGRPHLAPHTAGSAELSASPRVCHTGRQATLHHPVPPHATRARPRAHRRLGSYAEPITYFHALLVAASTQFGSPSPGGVPGRTAGWVPDRPSSFAQCPTRPGRNDTSALSTKLDATRTAVSRARPFVRGHGEGVRGVPELADVQSEVTDDRRRKRHGASPRFGLRDGSSRDVPPARPMANRDGVDLAMRYVRSFRRGHRVLCRLVYL